MTRISQSVVYTSQLGDSGLGTSSRCRYRRSLIRLSIRSFFFFFQAEDGIRVLYVTGVQTCALPIYRRIRVPGQGRMRPAYSREWILWRGPRGGRGRGEAWVVIVAEVEWKRRRLSEIENIDQENALRSQRPRPDTLRAR